MSSRHGLMLWMSVLVVACGGEAAHSPSRAEDRPEPPEPEPALPGGASTSGGKAPAGGVPAAAGSATSGGDAASGGASSSGGASTSGGVSTSGGASTSEDAGAENEGGGASTGDGGSAGEPPTRPCDPIVFEDPELELAVRAELGKPTGPLGAADVQGFTQLVTPSITSLNGVECLLDLTSLDIGSQPPSHVTDLSPLRGLKKLVDVDLDRNPLAGLAPLGELPNLESLYMLKMPVPLDLAPLAGAPKLSNLLMQGDDIIDLAPLGAVGTLRTLVIDGSTVQRPEGVALLTSLESLTATGVFDDAAPLATLTLLQRLRIAGHPLAHFSALATLINLRLLDVSNTGISDIGAVAHLPQLSSFFASSNQITDLAPLAGLAQLNLVALINNQVTDLTPLSDNPALGATDFVYLQGNPFSCSEQQPSLDALHARGVEVQSSCP
ncbi:MAG TPA: leucine-rich repeat domain-containing protein [Polyangiaceae bacterium]|nr:leucine-rich repeat domain-containing protein [Polyangiaceae bacterium]